MKIKIKNHHIILVGLNIQEIIWMVTPENILSNKLN